MMQNSITGWLNDSPHPKRGEETEGDGYANGRGGNRDGSGWWQRTGWCRRRRHRIVRGRQAERCESTYIPKILFHHGPARLALA